MSTDATQQPWDFAVQELKSSFAQRDIIRKYCQQYADQQNAELAKEYEQSLLKVSMLTQENQRLRAQIESLDFGPPVSESDINEMAEERNRLRDELQSARREIERLRRLLRCIMDESDRDTQSYREAREALNAQTHAKP